MFLLCLFEFLCKNVYKMLRIVVKIDCLCNNVF